MERKKKSKTKSKATHNENNNIINITLGEKIEKILKETVEVVEPTIIESQVEQSTEDLQQQETVDELQIAIKEFDIVKQRADELGVLIPANINSIPNNLTNVDSIEEIIVLTDDLRMRINIVNQLILEKLKNPTPVPTAPPTIGQVPQAPAFPTRPQFGFRGTSSNDMLVQQQKELLQKQQVAIDELNKKNANRPAQGPNIVPPTVPPYTPPPQAPQTPTAPPATEPPVTQPPASAPAPAPAPVPVPAPAKPPTSGPEPDSDYEDDDDVAPIQMGGTPLQRSKIITEYYRNVSNLPQQASQNEAFLMKLNRDIATLRNNKRIASTSASQMGIMRYLNELTTTRQGFLMSINRPLPESTGTTTVNDPDKPNVQEIDKSAEMLSLLEGRKLKLNEYKSTVYEGRATSLINNEIDTRLTLINNNINKINNNETITSSELERSLINNLISDRGEFPAVNAYETLVIRGFPGIPRNPTSLKLNQYLYENNIFYLYIDDVKQNQVFDSRGFLRENVTARPLNEDTVHETDRNDSIEIQKEKIKKARDEHCKLKTSESKESRNFWISSAGPDGAAFWKENDCGSTLGEAISRWLEQYSAPITIPDRAPPTSQFGGPNLRP